MKLQVKIILTLLIWAGLPLILFAYTNINNASDSISKSSMLFVMYSSFSWSIALMAFVMGSARQQLLQQTSAVRSGLQLGLYGCFAVTLAVLTSPWLNDARLTEMSAVMSLAFVYCYVMGLIYVRLILAK